MIHRTIVMTARHLRDGVVHFYHLMLMLEMHTNEATHKSSPFLKIQIHKNFTLLLEWVFTKCKCVLRVNTNWLHHASPHNTRQYQTRWRWTIGEGRLTPIIGGEQHSPWWHPTRAPSSWLESRGQQRGHIKPPHLYTGPSLQPSLQDAAGAPPPHPHPRHHRLRRLKVSGLLHFWLR